MGVRPHSTLLLRRQVFQRLSVSMMLKALEASGVVVRVKSGKTKVVRLVR
jgi:hypothetical protein